jgi:hypothetical protein
MCAGRRAERLGGAATRPGRRAIERRSPGGRSCVTLNAIQATRLRALTLEVFGSRTEAANTAFDG